MNDAAKEVISCLDRFGIRYDIRTHEIVNGIEDCIPIAGAMNAVIVKNYFLTTRNKKSVYLCLVQPEARFNSSSVSAQANASRLSFASDDMLMRYLRVRPGAVSPLGLIFDTEGSVRLLVDETLLSEERLAFHPCDGTVTVAMRTEDLFERFLGSLGRTYTTVKI